MIRPIWRWGAVALTAALLLALLLGPRMVASRLNPVLAAPPESAVSEAARALHDSLFVADLHTDALLWNRSILDRGAYGHVDLPRLADGRVAVQMFTAVTQVPRGMNLEANDADSDQLIALAILQRWPMRAWTSPLARALHQADKLREAAARSRGRLSVITTRDDLRAFLASGAQREGSVGGLLGLEGAHVLEGDVAHLETLFDAGYRMLGLTHFFDNAVGGSAHGLDKGGLTAMGETVLERMAELGMIIDLAHASPALIDDVLERTEGPVVVSHTGVDGTCASPRNLDDTRLRGIASTGGVIGIGLWPEAVCGETPADWARAVRYTADLVGVEHVALGSDWDGAVPAIVDAAATVHLTAALLGTGFTSEEVRAILGENTVRVLLETLPQELAVTRTSTPFTTLTPRTP